MNICYFPGRETGYSRNRVLLKAMKEVGITVYDCSYPQKNFFRYGFGFLKFLKYKSKSDIIFVGFLGQFLVPIVKLFTRKRIVFDAFVSLYQTLAFDRKTIHPDGMIAKFAKFIDTYSCRLADKVILDTHQHIQFFIKKFHLSENKFHRILVGSDCSVMYPRVQKNNEFLVHFHGEFQALHGTEYIVEAAKLLPDVKFNMIGEGRDLNKCLEKVERENIQNIHFIPKVSYEELAEYISKASVCLGLFGNTQKTQMVIPHKVYEALAMKKPVITADTPAIRELLTDGESAVLCATADATSLAESIQKLKNNKEQQIKIAERGHGQFIENCTASVLGKQILNICQELL